MYLAPLLTPEGRPNSFQTDGDKVDNPMPLLRREEDNAYALCFHPDRWQISQYSPAVVKVLRGSELNGKCGLLVSELYQFSTAALKNHHKCNVVKQHRFAVCVRNLAGSPGLKGSVGSLCVFPGF